VVSHLGLYETPWLAAFAYNLALGFLGRERRPVDIPRADQPTAEQVRDITERVRKRLAIDEGRRRRGEIEIPPDASELIAFFQVVVVGFHRREAADDHGGPPGSAIDRAAERLVHSARLLFWSRSAGHPKAEIVLTDALVRRLDVMFHNERLTREVLDDDGDEPYRVARWLVYPDDSPALRVRTFLDEVRYLYPEPFEETLHEDPASWAAVLGLVPPFGIEDIRAAFRQKSKSAHPDAGGSSEAFVRLREAYEEAMAYCYSRG
jgi:hypothetical protein